MAAKIVLLEKVTNLGDPGTVHSVKDGYARNYLIKNKLAEMATEKALQRAKLFLAKEKAKKQIADSEAKELKNKLEKLTFSIKHKATAGKLFGSVKAQTIVELLKAEAPGITNKQVQIAKPIKEIGEHMVTINLTKDISATIKIKVENEGKKEK